MPRTLLQLLAPGILAYADVNDYWNKSPNLAGTMPAGPTNNRRKLWADPAAIRAIGDRTPPAIVFWGAQPVPASVASPAPEFEYTVLATDPAGRALLTPIESAPACACYSQTVLNTYREKQQFFPQGIPYTVKLRLPAEVAGALNFQANGPEFLLPIDLGQNVLLVPDGRGGVLGYDYQEFFAASRVPEGWTDERRLQEIDLVRDNGRKLGTAAALQISAIRDLVTYSGGKSQLT